MTAPRIRVRGIPIVGRDVPKSVAPILTAVRESIQELNGDSTFGAVRRAQFLELLRASIGKVIVPGGSGNGGADNSSITDPYFQDLKKQTEQALTDIASLFAYNNVSELMVSENREYITGVEASVIEHADELAEQALDLATQAQDLLDLATDLDAIEVEVNDAAAGLAAQATLLDATVVRVDSTEGSIDALTAQITSLESEIVDVAALDPAVMWQFESSDDGWTSNVTITPETAHVSLAAGASAHFTSPPGIAINGALYPRIVARMRRASGTGWLGRATYVTTGSGSHGLDSTNFHLTLASEPVFAGGGWVIVTWNMELLTAGGDDWVTHVVDQIRLELSDDAATVFDVDWVALARIAPSYVTSTVNALESRVTQTEDDIDAISAAITSLETDVDDLDGGVSANTAAISTLSTRITTTEGDIDANSASIVALDSRLDDAESDITAQTTAISGLTTSVTSIDGALASHSSQLTSLDARLDSVEPEVSGQAAAISSLEANVTSIDGELSSHSSQLTSLDSRVDATEADLSADASAIAALDTRIDSAESTITSHSLSLVSLDARLDGAESNISGQATAVTNLNARVTSAEAGVSSAATAVTMLQVRGGMGGNLVNPLNSSGFAAGWAGLANADVVNINIGGRSATAARVRTAGNVEISSTVVDNIDPSAIYEVRFSYLKNLAHGSIYLGCNAYSDSIAEVAVTPVNNRAAYSGPAPNPYFFSTANPVAGAWQDVVFYILGSDVPYEKCPRMMANNQSGTFPVGASFAVDGFRLPAGCRKARLRFLNYYNSALTDLFVTNVEFKRIDNQYTAALTEEASVRFNADGLLNAQWSLKLDVNGYVVGFGLSVVGGANGPISSSFNVVADRFNIAMPGVAGPTAVFTIGNINGVPTVGINGNLVVDGTIVTRHIIANGISRPLLVRRGYGPETMNGASEVNIANATFNPATGSPVVINIQLGAETPATGMLVGFGTMQNAQALIYRNGVLLRRQLIGGTSAPPQIFLVDIPPVGVTTYSLNVQMTPGSNFTVTYPRVEFLALEQLR